MNKSQEALNELKDFVHSELDGTRMLDKHLGYVNTLQQLVDKEIPKKPTKYKTIHHSIEDIILYKCQCGCCLSYAYNFCPKCGQAIKWSDE